LGLHLLFENLFDSKKKTLAGARANKSQGISPALHLGGNIFMEACAANPLSSA